MYDVSCDMCGSPFSRWPIKGGREDGFVAALEQGGRCGPCCDNHGHPTDPAARFPFPYSSPDGVEDYLDRRESERAAFDAAYWEGVK